MSLVKRAVAVAATAGVVLIGGAGVASADAEADAVAVGSPGVLSGNIVQLPIHIPINICGNTINAVGLLNPAFGNVCINDGDSKKGESKKSDSKKNDDGKHGDDGKQDGYGNKR
ncbi:chaplin [Streptomyces sp. NPDC050856]|uniref:chaplin n=1 Tax=Streptomyces sp. NPDC050856 TaxID=3154939 RepID=UPI0033EE8E7C